MDRNIKLSKCKIFPLFCGKQVICEKQLNASFALHLVVQTVLDDQPPPVVPRKQSVAEMTTGKAKPNTYVGVQGSRKEGEALFENCMVRL